MPNLTPVLYTGEGSCYNTLEVSNDSSRRVKLSFKLHNRLITYALMLNDFELLREYMCTQNVQQMITKLVVKTM